MTDHADRPPNAIDDYGLTTAMVAELCGDQNVTANLEGLERHGFLTRTTDKRGQTVWWRTMPPEVRQQ